MSGYKFYMSRYINNSWEEEVSLEDYFEGMKYSKCDGLSTFGKPKNIYTESYAEEEKLRVYIPPTVVRENTDIEFEFIFSGGNRRSVYNSFVDWITGYKIKYRDTCRGKEVEMILIEAIEPEDDFLYGSDPYIASAFKFKNLIGSSVDNGGIEPDACPTLEELTIDGTATESDIAVGKIAYSKGERLVGTMPTKIDVEALKIKFANSQFTEIPSIFDFSNVRFTTIMFENCANLPVINGLAIPNAIDSFSMFNGCISLNSVSNLDLRKSANTVNMFVDCKNLVSVTNCNFSSLENSGSMFWNCTKLQTISSIDFTNITAASNMFYGCSSLAHFNNITPISCSLSFADSPLLDSGDAESYVLGQLADLTGKPSQTITFNTALQGAISESAIQAATDKNWVVNFADSM